MKKILLSIVFLAGVIPVLSQCPTEYEVSGGGGMCAGMIAEIYLSGANPGYKYQLKRNGINEGFEVIASSPGGLVWQAEAEGTYTVHATNPANGCTRTMLGSAVVVIEAPLQFTVGGGGVFCTQANAMITLNDSEIGTTYTLNRNGSFYQSPTSIKGGTGALLTWSNLPNGVYTVNAQLGEPNFCFDFMSGSATVTIDPNQVPVAAISGPRKIGTGTIELATPSGQGYTYQWYRDEDLTNGAVQRTLTVDKSGNYTVVVTNSQGCTKTSPGHFVTVQQVPMFNGIISSVGWRTDKPHDVTGSDYTGMFVYKYDAKYQVNEATWAVPNFTLNTFSYTNTFRVSDISYDRNGNILSLKRFNDTGVRQHNFAYQYNTNPANPQTNKLQNIPGYASYQYNSLGQLTVEDKATGGDQYVEYDAAGKVRKVYSDAAKQNMKVEYLYDDRGFRLAKKDIASGKTTWYIRDAGGNVLSVYESANGSAQAKQIEAPVYGSGKVGTYYPKQESAGYYQDGSTDYEITDHLSNVRALVRDNVNAYAASMEDSGQPVATNPRVKEMAHFINLFETEKNDVYMNHSPATAEVGSPNKSAYLFWQDGVLGMDDSDKLVGPGIMLGVKAGDKVNAEAWVRYERKASYARNIDIFMLSQFLGGNFVGMGGFDGYTVSQASSTFQSALTGANFMSDGADEIRPFAYLNYILFNENMTLADAGWMRIPENAGHISGQESLPGMHKKVAFDESVEVEANGYIYVWVSNESENTKVWFDDLKVTHEESIVTQSTDYGVWGDVIREQKSAQINYRYGYQGQFAEEDTQTGWNHFYAREFDPVIGRWTTTDPAGQYWAPYMAMGNDPLSNIDPSGEYSRPGAFFRALWAGENPFHIKKDLVTGEWGYNTSTLEDTDLIGITPTTVITPHFGDEKQKTIMKTWKPDFLDRWGASDNIGWSWSYKFVDKFYVTGQFFTPWTGKDHLDGQPTVSDERVVAMAEVAATMLPWAKLTPKMSASEFSSLTRGTFLARMPGKSRAQVMKQLNRFGRSPLGYPKRIKQAPGQFDNAIDFLTGED